jgi:hypothetical protein
MFALALDGKAFDWAICHNQDEPMPHDLEGLFEQPAGPLNNLPRPFCRTHTDVLACRGGTFPDSSSGIDGMKSSQVAGALTGTLSKIACALARTFPNVAAPTSYIATRASALFLSSLSRTLIWRGSRLILPIGTHLECK